MKAIQIILNPREEKKLALTSMCTQNLKACPPSGELFPSNDIATGYLFDLATLINDKGYQKSPAQSGIWAITDGASNEYIYSLDTTMTKDICSIVSTATGNKCPSDKLTPKKHRISFISTSIEFLSEIRVNNTSLSVYNLSTNTLLKTYWKNNDLAPGYHHFKIGYTHHAADSTKFRLRLNDSNGNTP